MWHWLVHTGHIYTALVGAACGIFMTTTVVGIIYKRVISPTTKRIQEAYHKHEQTQQEIADSLDPTTPNGIGPQIKKLTELTEIATQLNQGQSED